MRPDDKLAALVWLVREMLPADQARARGGGGGQGGVGAGVGGGRVTTAPRRRREARAARGAPRPTPRHPRSPPPPRPPQSTIVFVSTRHHAEFIHQLLAKEGVEAAVVYGAMDQVCVGGVTPGGGVDQVGARPHGGRGIVYGAMDRVGGLGGGGGGGGWGWGGGLDGPCGARPHGGRGASCTARAHLEGRLGPRGAPLAAPH